VLIVAMPSKTSGRTSAAEFVDTPVFVLPIDPTFAF
jgi:hypothetical protein